MPLSFPTSIRLTAQTLEKLDKITKSNPNTTRGQLIQLAIQQFLLPPKQKAIQSIQELITSKQLNEQQTVEFGKLMLNELGLYVADTKTLTPNNPQSDSNYP